MAYTAASNPVPPPARPARSCRPRGPRRSTPTPSQLRESTYIELKRRLLSGELSSSAILSQRQLARLLGTSNTPVRSAIERLESEGLLRIEPRRGVVLRELEPREVAELYEIRAALESYAVAAIAGRLTDEQARHLRASLQDQEQAAARADTAALIELDAAFHLMICGFLGNRQVVATLERLGDQIRRVIVRVTSVYPYRLAESVAEHRGIAEAILAGDGGLAALRLTQHLGRGRALVVPGASAPPPTSPLPT